jgi:multiple sugar transport system substrate-binding protein
VETRSRLLTRRQMLAGMALTMGAAAMGACAAPTAIPTPASPTPVPVKPTVLPTVGKPRTLRILRRSSFVPAEDKWVSEWLRDNWAKPNNVDLQVEHVNASDLQPKIAVAIESGSGPDIIMTVYHWPNLYANKLLDLGTIANKFSTDGGGIYDVYKAFMQVNGVWKAVPFGLIGNCMAYRSDWLKEIGEAKPPDTWDELNRVGKLMKSKGKPPFGAAWGHANDGTVCAQSLNWSFGGKEVEADGRTVAINSKETLAAVEYAVQWFKDSLAPEMVGWDDAANNRVYAAEQIWGTFNAASVYMNAKNSMPALAANTDHALYCAGPKGRFLTGDALGYAVPAYVQDAGLARDCLAFLFDIKNFAGFVQAGGGFTSPPVKSFANDPMWDKDPKMKLLNDVSYYKWPGWPGPPTAAASEAQTSFVLVDMFAKAMTGSTPQQAISWAEGELKRIYGKA